MPTDDRTNTNDEIRAQTNPPVDDLRPKDLDSKTADQVKGGGKVTTGDLHITKPTDRSSP